MQDVHSIVTVVLKGEDNKFQKKFSCYQAFSISKTDEKIQNFIREAREEYRGTPDEIEVKVSLLITD